MYLVGYFVVCSSDFIGYITPFKSRPSLFLVNVMFLMCYDYNYFAWKHLHRRGRRVSSSKLVFSSLKQKKEERQCLLHTDFELVVYLRIMLIFCCPRYSCEKAGVYRDAH